MKTRLWIAFVASLMAAQTKPAFEVATIKPSAPIDVAKTVAAIRAGQPPKIGSHIEGAKAEYTFLTLKDLVALAYNVSANQVTGPDWIAPASDSIS